jgi:hypothetical protein
MGETTATIDTLDSQLDYATVVAKLREVALDYAITKIRATQSAEAAAPADALADAARALRVVHTCDSLVRPTTLCWVREHVDLEAGWKA